MAYAHVFIHYAAISQCNYGTLSRFLFLVSMLPAAHVHCGDPSQPADGVLLFAQTSPACADCAFDARFALAAAGAGYGSGPAAGQGGDPGHQGQPGVAGHQVCRAALPLAIAIS